MNISILGVEVSGESKSDVWFIDPRVGFYARGMINNHSSIKSKASASLNFQKFHDINASLQNTTFDDDFVILPIFVQLLGSNFSHYFCSSLLHFSKGYKPQILWDQNILYKYKALLLDTA